MSLYVQVPGRWVHFVETDDCGEEIDGFYINEKRAETFDQEPGFRRHILCKLYVRADAKD